MLVSKLPYGARPACQRADRRQAAEGCRSDGHQHRAVSASCGLVPPMGCRPVRPGTGAAKSRVTDIRAVCIGDKEIDAQVAASLPVDLQKANLQHDLLRRRDTHGVDDDAALWDGAGGNRHGPLGGDGVDCRSAQHHLALGSRDANARVPVLARIFCCRLPVSIATSTSRIPICFIESIEQDDVGGAGLLALDINHVIAERLDVDDVRRAGNNRRKRRIDPEGARLVDDHLDPLDVVHFADEDAAPEEPADLQPPLGQRKRNKTSAAPRAITLKARSLAPAWPETRPPHHSIPLAAFCGCPDKRAQRLQLCFADHVGNSRDHRSVAPRLQVKDLLSRSPFPQKLTSCCGIATPS